MPTTVARILAALLLSLVGAVAAPAPMACACSCMELDTEGAIASASDVFDGTVTSRSQPTSGYTAELIEYTIDVTRVYKGDVLDRVIVRSAAHGASCGLELTGRVTVFAHRSDGYLLTTLCSAPATLDRSQLGDGHPPTPHPGGTAAVDTVGWLVGGVAGVLVLAGTAIWLVRRRPG